MTALRVWRGWRHPRFAGEAGMRRFEQGLRETFVPATWQVMQRFGLECYLPSLLDGSGADLPDEVALLFYRDVQSYDGAKSTVAGRSYSVMHQAYFNFDEKPVSASGWAASAWTEAEGTSDATRFSQALWRQASDQAPTLAEGACHALFIALSHDEAAAPTVEAAFSALAPAAEAVAVIERTFTLLWLAVSEPGEADTLAQPVLDKLAGTTLATAQLSRDVGLATEFFIPLNESIDLAAGQTLRFVRC